MWHTKSPPPVTTSPYNGKIKAMFEVPATYNLANVGVFYVSDDGNVEVIPCTVDAANDTVIAELSHFSSYIVAEKTVPQTLTLNQNDTQKSYAYIAISFTETITLHKVQVYYTFHKTKSIWRFILNKLPFL